MNNLEVKLTQELIKFATVHTEDKGIMRFLSKRLTSIGFKCTTIKSGLGSKSALNLYARYGKSKPNLMTVSHSDVVANIKGWKYPPFSAKIKKGYIYGRGAQDLKGNLACWISAVSKFIKDKKFKGSLSLIVAADEETSAMGTPACLRYLKKNKEKIDFAITIEPTSRLIVGDEIRIGRRGSMNAKLKIVGKSGHTAFKNSFKNPCTTLARTISKLKNTKLDSGTKYMPPSHLEITKMSVDNLSENVVPESAEAYFNVRFNSKHKSSSLKKKLNRIISSVVKKDKCNFKVDYRVSGEAFYTKPNKEIYMIQKSVREITGKTPKLNCGGGTSDSRFLHSIPRLELGLTNEYCHQINERVKIKDLKKLTRIYYRILKNYFR